MFKQSKNRIVLLIMSVLVLLWLGTLSIIYIFSYFSVVERNYDMLQSHVDFYKLKDDDRKENFKDMEGPKFDKNPAYMLSTFYTVVMTDEGKVIEVSNPQPDIHSDENLKSEALTVFESKEIKGKTSNLLYYSKEKHNVRIIAFMDNTLFQDSISTLFKYTLLFGASVIFVFFFLARYLSHKIVQPLEDSYEKQRQFISDASHELKTPVSVINANAEILAKDIGSNQWLSNIQYENHQMAQLISQLLDLTHTESLVFTKEKLDFAHLIEREVLPFESVAYEKGLTINMDLTTPVYINGNNNKLCQLVSTLLENAISHGEKGTAISLSLKNNHKYAFFKVTNCGQEIPKDHLDHIFERFYRVDSSRTEKGHYGLGLAIAKAIAISHNGSISVSCSNGEIQFTVKIPLI